MSTSFLQSTRRVLLFLPTSKGLVLAFVLRSRAFAPFHIRAINRRRETSVENRKRKREKGSTRLINSPFSIYFLPPFQKYTLSRPSFDLWSKLLIRPNIFQNYSPFISSFYYIQTFIFSIDFFKIIQILITKEKMLSQIFFYYIISSNSWKIRSKLILLAWNTNGYK